MKPGKDCGLTIVKPSDKNKMINNQIHVLLIEDNPRNTQLICEMLGRDAENQFDLKCVHSLKSGLKQLAEKEFDVVLSSLGLPNSHGLETFVKLSAQKAELPIVLLADFGEKPLAIEAQKKEIPVCLVQGQMDGELLSRAIRNAIKCMRVEKELQQIEKKYSRLIENLQEGIWVIDKNACTTFINQRMAEMLGYTVEEMLGKPLFSFMDEGSAEACKNYLECLKWNVKKQQEIEFFRKNGTKIFVNMKMSSLTDDDENYLGAMASILDITEHKRAEEQIKALLAEKEVLLGEIHHRVKSNMQIISSLLNLQSSHMKNKDFIKMVKNSQSRVRSIALIHEKLYRSQDLSRINFSEYVQSLAVHLFQFNQINSNLIKLKMNLENVFLDIQTAVPCGLILNELITNSLKHAFPEGRGGEIIVELHPLEEHTFQMVVKDNGVGIPKDLDINYTTTLGFQIAAMLVKQIEGLMEVQKEGGTTIKIVFRELRSTFSSRYSCWSGHE